jgi:hypothetical protein
MCLEGCMHVCVCERLVRFIVRTPNNISVSLCFFLSFFLSLSLSLSLYLSLSLSLSLSRARLVDCQLGNLFTDFLLTAFARIRAVFHDDVRCLQAVINLSLALRLCVSCFFGCLSVFCSAPRPQRSHSLTCNHSHAPAGTDAALYGAVP